MVKYCSDCGNEVQSGATFCPSCGHNLKQSSPKTERTEPPKQNFITTVIIVLVFIGIISTIFIGFLYINEIGFQDLTTSTKTVSIYIDTLPNGVDPIYLNAVREAKAFWEKRQDVIFEEVSSQNEADVTVKWIKEFGGKTLAHVINEKYVEIGLGDSNCLGKWKVYKYKTVSDLAIHELGHVIGYDDDYENNNNVMYYTTSTSYETDVEENGILPDGEIKLYPVCTKKPAATYSIEVTSSEPLNIYVGALVNGNEFSNFPDCKGDKVEIHKKTCTVTYGSDVVLSNPTTFGLGASARYFIKIKEI
ncbi:MAG: zinc-ribbon domain-containing protein [Candidatus Omnitrophica bacterium]|nr:zinc-ribbon domain-containing protein [Candidatus Omnitrophota bacterium]